MSTEKKHAKYAASSAFRWLNCSAAVSLSAKMPEPPESVYAKEGTDAHAILEAILTKKKIKKYDATQYMFAKSAADHIHWVKSKTGGELLVETKVSLKFIHEEAYGTLDAAVLEHFGRLHVIDFKYGQGHAVEVKDNPQLIFYGLALAHEYDYNFTDVENTVIQPRAPHKEGPIRRHTFSIDEYVFWIEKFKRAIDASEKKNPKPTAGEWCKWCPAAPICPAISSKAMEQAQIDFSDAALGTLPKMDLKALTEEHLGEVLDAIDKLEIWISETRKLAFDKLSRGDKISGYKLVPKRARRVWIDAELAADYFKKHLDGAQLAYAFKEQMLSPAQMEKIAGKKRVAKWATKVSSGLTMVREKDERAATNQIAIDFKDDYIEDKTKTKRGKYGKRKNGYR